MPSATRRMASTSSWPLSRLGVPTQIRAKSDPETPSSVEVVARRRPAGVTSASSSPSPGSTRGEIPPLTMATLSGLMSTPITWWPALARQAAVTQPTYPRPKMLTRMPRHDLLAMTFELPGDLGPGIPRLHQPASRHAQGVAAVRVLEQGDDGLSEVRRTVGLEEMLAGHDGEPFGANPSGHHRLAHGQGLEDLQPGSSADSQWHDVDCGFSHEGAYIWHGSRHPDPSGSARRPQPVRRVSSHHGYREPRDLLPELREDRGDEIHDGVLIGVPVHGPREHQ